MLKKMLNNKSVFLFLITAIIAFSLSSMADIVKNYVPDNNIEVFNVKQKQIVDSHNFIGVNWIEDHECNRAIFQPDNLVKLAKVLKANNIDYIRYPGGLNATLNYWNVSYKDFLDAFRNLPRFEQAWLARFSLEPNDRMDFYSFLGFCRNNDIKTTVQVNTQSFFDKNVHKIYLLKKYDYDTKQERVYGSGKIDWKLVESAADYAAQQVKWAKDNGYLSTIKYWELGNEEYAPKWFMNASYTGYEYAEVCKIFIKKMKAIDPSIKFVVSMIDPNDYPALSDLYAHIYLTKWVDSFFKNKELLKYKDSIYAFSDHLYIKPDKFNQNCEFEDFQSMVLKTNNYNTNQKLNSFQNLVTKAGYGKSKIFMNEFNVNDFQNKYMHTWLSTLSLSKMILSATNNPYCSHIDYHALFHFYKDVSLGFGMFHFAQNNTETPFISYPAAYVIDLLNNNIKGDILKTSFDNKQIYLTAINNNNCIKVIILNMDKEKTVNLKFSGFKNLIYAKNQSLGVGIKPWFTVMNENDSMENPSVIRSLNIAENSIKINQESGLYKIDLPAYTLSVFEFKNTLQ